MISPEQRSRLASLYDQFHAADIPYDEFRRYAVYQCKLYLRKN